MKKRATSDHFKHCKMDGDILSMTHMFVPITGYFENYMRPEKDLKGKALFETIDEDSEWEKLT